MGISEAAQKCMYCNRAANISDCATNIIECSDAEVSGLVKLILIDSRQGSVTCKGKDDIIDALWSV